MKARLLIDCPGERFHKGEIGKVLENDSDKYDYCIRLPEKVEVELLGKITQAIRIFYFYKDEVELFEEEDQNAGID